MKFSSLQLSQQQRGRRVHRESPEFKTSTTGLAYRIVPVSPFWYNCYTLWVRFHFNRRLYSVIFEVREDEEGEFYHLVTLWKATREERTLYEENS
jgi:hypothetical protein